MAEQTFKSANRRYFRGFVPLMVSYLIIILAGSFYLKSLDIEPLWLQSLIAVGASLPVILFALLELRFINETDEYTRSIRLKAMSYSWAILCSTVFIVGFLQMFDVISNVEVFWFGPAFFVAYGLSTVMIGGKECL